MIMQTRVLPIMYVLLFGALMVTCSVILPAYNYPSHSNVAASITLFTIAILIIAISGYQFRKVSTTVNPLTPNKTSKLVVTGFYRYSRNPMYVGFFLLLVALEVWLTNIISLVFLPLFVVTINRMQIQPEEKALEELFGDEFRQYVMRVRRWI